ncbi:MAG: WecB/TagA/CpsF family glycosyltransferase [Verrucomicrobia bacterium]|nr:WecB/TagA/CpsF family glycosyltransferase [Verrucomicrobiota bacterium]
MPAGPERTILGVRFFAGSSEAAVERGLAGGLVVVPSAPMLVELAHDLEYRAAATEADLVITDSGFMVLLWWLLRREWLPRTSGLKYLQIMLGPERRRSLGRCVWIMPSLAAARRLVAWLSSQRVVASLDDCYIAPHYSAGPVVDQELLVFVRSRSPSQVVVALGGGTQEKLGLHLKQRLGFPVGIHCIGAAIGFLTGDQVRIPTWADRMFLGWLARCLSAPSRFIPRYWKSLSLGILLWRYQESTPSPHP